MLIVSKSCRVGGRARTDIFGKSMQGEPVFWRLTQFLDVLLRNYVDKVILPAW